MATIRELTYLVLDELKLVSDDDYFNEEHIMFLLGKYRNLLLELKYKSNKDEIPSSNYQTLCVGLEQVPAIAGEECEGGVYLKSKVKVPSPSSVVPPTVYPPDYYNGSIVYVSRERMRYVGYNKWLQNIIYASIGPDDYLYFKSSNPQYLYLENVKVTGVFDDYLAAAELSGCNSENNCDVLDNEFPMEEALVPTLIEAIVKELTGAIYKPTDKANDAADDLSDIASFIRSNMKENVKKKVDGDE